MKLFNKKQQSEDVKNIIEILNLKNQPYEIKEDVMNFVGASLPIMVFYVGSKFFEIPVVMAIFSLILYPSFFIAFTGTQLACKERKNKVNKAEKTYNKFSNECVNFLTEEEKSKLLANANKFENSPQTIEQMANKIKIANARRNAKFISKYEYKRQLNELSK